MTSHFIGRLLVRISCVLAFASPALSKPRYLHATTGNIDIVSSMSEERTTRLLHEFIGIRRIVEDLLGTPVDQPATRLIVFGSQNEMDAFYPEEQWGNWKFNTKWHTATTSQGEVFSVISDWPNDRIYRQGALKRYASNLISRALPNCPYWIYEGLATALCTIEYRDGTVRLGESRIDRSDIKFIPAERLPLAETLGKIWNSKDVPGLWQMWLTQDYEGNRVKIRRLAELIRHGAPGDAATLARAFDQPVSEIQATLYRHMKRLREPTVDRPALTTDLLQKIDYRPATEFEMSVARSFVLVTLEKRPPGLTATLAWLAQAEPASPLPNELLAWLATAENDLATADRHWQQACEKQTGNPYAYLIPLRQSLEPRARQINLAPSLTQERTSELRRYADACVDRNPGSLEGFQWLAWIEALAPAPDAERVERARNTHARFLRPGTYFPLIIADIRLQRFPQAIALLDEYEQIFGPADNNQGVINFLRKKIPPS